MAHEDFFLKVDSEKGGAIKGEAQDSDHKDEIDVIELVLGNVGPHVGHRPAQRAGQRSSSWWSASDADSASTRADGGAVAATTKHEDGWS